MSSTIDSCFGAFALELSPGTPVQLTLLDTTAAGELAERVAADLARFFPPAAQLDLALLAGLFDPVELLRPGWPLHSEIERLIAQAPEKSGARIIAFGARDGELPQSLCPDAEHGHGALRLLPFVLRGAATTVCDTSAQFEQSLLDTGMAAAETALLAQTSFGANIAHARYLTINDLAAMTAIQYENVGLGALWPLIETALLSPDQDQWLDAPPEPLARYCQGQARIALLDFAGWLHGGFAPKRFSAASEYAHLARAFDQFQLRQQQIAALLQAHGIPVTFNHCHAGTDARRGLID